jgi:hypothetical protein
MLLVHHDEAESSEADALLNEGMGADGDLGRAPITERGESGSPFGGRHPAGEEDDIEVEPGLTEKPSERSGVLLREEFRRSHEGGLVVVLRGEEHREEGDERLPGSHVTLEKPVHPASRGHVLE